METEGSLGLTLTNECSQKGELQVQSETSPPKGRWTVTEKDAQC